jgi:hypothetical protein
VKLEFLDLLEELVEGFSIDHLPVYEFRGILIEGVTEGLHLIGRELAHELEDFLIDLDGLLGVLKAVLGTKIGFSDPDQGLPVHGFFDIEP